MYWKLCRQFKSELECHFEVNNIKGLLTNFWMFSSIAIKKDFFYLFLLFSDWSFPEMMFSPDVLQSIASHSKYTRARARTHTHTHTHKHTHTHTQTHTHTHTRIREKRKSFHFVGLEVVGSVNCVPFLSVLDKKKKNLTKTFRVQLHQVSISSTNFSYERQFGSFSLVTFWL
jgi:hypothetical protein